MFSAQPVITETGRALLLRAAGGEQITFTKFQAGSGHLATGEDPHTVTALKQVALSNIPITKAEDTEENGYIQLMGSFDNQVDVQADFLWTELGLIAEDEDGTEYLYAYGYDGEYAELIKAGGSAVVLEQSISAIIAIGDSENITVNVLPNATYASRSEFLAHTGDDSNPHGVTWQQTGAAQAAHSHSAADITAGILPVARGGTGADTIDLLRSNLGVNCAVGVVFGDGTTRKDVTLGFAPTQVVLIPLQWQSFQRSFASASWHFARQRNYFHLSDSTTVYFYCDADTLFNRGHGGCAVTETGFAMGRYQDNTDQINLNGWPYLYIAFRE